MSVLAGLGTLLQYENPTSTWNTVAQRVEIQGPPLEMGEADQTHLDSTAKEYRPTILDAGELSLKIWYDPSDTSHAFITTDLLAKTARQWRITNTATTFARLRFTAFVKGFQEGGMDAEGNLEADVTFRITGTVVIE